MISHEVDAIASAAARRPPVPVACVAGVLSISTIAVADIVNLTCQA